jgi:hypothetical protein
LQERFDKSPANRDALLVSDPPGFEKMSAVLLEFARPFMDVAIDDEDRKAILVLAMLAWNLSLLPEAECEQQLQKLLLPKLDRPNQIMVRKMITRRRTHFAHHHRQVLDHVIEIKGRDLRLDVVTTL